jgi:nicotinamide-nucleotide amidase
MRAELISIGEELLNGEVTDTNAAYLAGRMLALGLPLRQVRTVGDEAEEIAAAFRDALSRAELVLATGGLGPTADDLTMSALAQAVGVKLEFRPEVLSQMARRLKRPVSALPPANRKQAFVPAGAAILRNEWGTAPGLRVRVRGRQVFLMPGVPAEMKGLFESHIVPILRRLAGRKAVAVRTYHSLGVPEAVIGARLRGLMREGLNPDVGTRVDGGVVTVRSVGQGRTQAQADRRAGSVEGRIRGAMGRGCFGEGDATPASATVQALRSRGATVAVAESCTAGLAAATLARIPGASRMLLGGAITYADAEKVRACGVLPETLARHGAVSAETAREMAEGIRRRAGADFGLSVTGIAGPSGGSRGKPVGLVFISVASARRTVATSWFLPGLDRNTFRGRAVNLALNALRCEAVEDFGREKSRITTRKTR